MQQTIPAFDFYTNNLQNLQQTAERLAKKSSQIAWLRLAVFLSTAFILYNFWQTGALLIVSIIILGVAIFLILLSTTATLKSRLTNTILLIKINKEELAILSNNFNEREEGIEFKPSHHSYENDIDIFGKDSLYQYINRCSSEQGRALMAKNLLNPQPTDFIINQQEAVAALSLTIPNIQQFLAYGLQEKITLATQQKINTWLQREESYFTWKGWPLLVNTYSIIAVTILGCYVFGVIDSKVFYPLAFVFFLFSFYQSKKIHSTYTLLSKIVNEIITLNNQLKWLETLEIKSNHINNLKSNISNHNATKASAEILALKNILDRFDIRLNVFVFYFLNTFLLWDTRQILALKHWKKNNALLLNEWFTAIVEMEVCISLATLYYNQPTFIFPTISPNHFEFSASNLGHPLIPANKRVNNSFSTIGTGKIALITGSNMGGKSTFLRSIGVNTVLALMGAPVCAEAFTISNIQLMSSMRIADNLAESTSTFYAELKKIQTIIEAVKQQQKVFILLDEILRGTNSLDRHTGSKALIQQLINQNAVAIIATHDVELAYMQNEFPLAINNYHFDVQVANEELYFDYKLKNGICTSMNASILMKKIGIEMG